MPRLCTDTAVAKEIGIDVSMFRHWVACGRMPKPIQGTDRYDLKACHAALDAMSGLDAGQGGKAGNALDAWRQGREAPHAG